MMPNDPDAAFPLHASRDSMTSFLVGALDLISVGVVAVDRELRLIHSNRYARQLLRQGSCLSIVGGMLACPQAGETARLRIAVSQCCDSERSDPIAFRLYDHRLSEFVEIAILRSTKPNDPLPLATIYVRNPDPRQAVSDSLLAALYGLTRAERKIASLLTQEGSVTLAAKARGVSPSTARTHLRSLLRKTGARRQVDLVQRLSTGLGGMMHLESDDAAMSPVRLGSPTATPPLEDGGI